MTGWVRLVWMLLVLPVHANESGVAQPLSSVPAEAERGRAVLLDRNAGHCLLCHQLSAVAESSQGNLGPSLDGVADRLSAAELRLRLIDSTRINPDSAMPAYHRTAGLQQVAPEFADQPVLSAAQIEDLIAYLLTLTSSPVNR